MKKTNLEKLEMIRAFMKRLGFEKVNTYFKNDEKSTKITFKIEGEIN